VLGAAINVYANKHKERPDRLIDMLTSSHRYDLVCLTMDFIMDLLCVYGRQRNHGNFCE